MTHCVFRTGTHISSRVRNFPRKTLNLFLAAVKKKVCIHNIFFGGFSTNIFSISISHATPETTTTQPIRWKTFHQVQQKHIFRVDLCAPTLWFTQFGRYTHIHASRWENPSIWKIFHNRFSFFFHNIKLAIVKIRTNTYISAIRVKSDVKMWEQTFYFISKFIQSIKGKVRFSKWKCLLGCVYKTSLLVQAMHKNWGVALA
jgi:hypothetical protein